MYGLRPGPLIFTESRGLVNQLFIIAILVQILLIPIGWLGIKTFSLILRLRSGIVLTAVVFFSIIGAYAIRNSFFDIYIMLIFGLIGYCLEKISVPLAPMILGLILGPMIEDNLRVGLIKTKGNFGPFLSRPISLILFIMIILILAGPQFFSLMKKNRPK